MKSKLILVNGTEIQFESGSSLADIRVVCVGTETLTSIMNELTEENLKEVTIVNSNDEITGAYENLVFVSETSTRENDGILCSINLRKKTDIELRLDALEESQADQNAAIEDLGTATSEIAQAVITEGE